MTQTNRNTSITIGVLVLALTAIVGVGMAADTQIVDSTIPVDNNSSTVYVDLTGDDNMTQDRTANVTIVGRPVGVSTENGTVLVDNESVTVSAGNTSSVEYTLNDSETTDYDDVQVQVYYPSNHAANVSTDWGVTTDSAGGGGGGLGGTGLSAGVLVVLVIAAVMLRED